MNEAYLNFIFEKYAIDYIVHGDDPCLVNGEDVYAAAKKLGTHFLRPSRLRKSNSGKYRSIPRTDGVSTTDIIGRILHPSSRMSDFSHPHALRVTSERILQFSNQRRSDEYSNIVYLPGHWDVHRPEYLKAFELAKSCGEFLLVGVYSDTSHSHYTLTCLERCLTVLGCKVSFFNRVCSYS